MKPKKALIENAKKDGSIDRMNQLLSAAYLLNTEASNLIGEAEDILREHGLMMGELKQLQNNFTKAADRYFAEFSTLSEKDKVMDYFLDYEAFDNWFRKWSHTERKEDEHDSCKPL